MSTTRDTVRTWFVGQGDHADIAGDLPVVVDNYLRIWRPDEDGRYHHGYQHASWRELRARFDLVEVTA